MCVIIKKFLYFVKKKKNERVHERSALKYFTCYIVREN